MDDRITFPCTKRQAQSLLTHIAEQALHDPQVNVQPALISTPDAGYALQVSRWDTQVVLALRRALYGAEDDAYCSRE